MILLALFIVRWRTRSEVLFRNLEMDPIRAGNIVSKVVTERKFRIMQEENTKTEDGVALKNDTVYGSAAC